MSHGITRSLQVSGPTLLWANGGGGEGGLFCPHLLWLNMDGLVSQFSPPFTCEARIIVHIY